MSSTVGLRLTPFEANSAAQLENHSYPRHGRTHRIFSALVLPFVWLRYADSASFANIELLAAFLLLVALPAHAFVMGFGRNQMANPRTLDTILLKRIGSWVAGVAATVVVAAMFRAS